MNRTGPLSDEAVMKMCKQFQPVPLVMSEQVLYDPPPKSKFIQTKPPKYVRPSPRPVNYNALAHALAKNIDPAHVSNIQERLDRVYDAQVTNFQAPTTVPNLPSGSSTQIDVATQTLLAQREEAGSSSSTQEVSSEGLSPDPTLFEKKGPESPRGKPQPKRKGRGEQITQELAVHFVGAEGAARAFHTPDRTVTRSSAHPKGVQSRPLSREELETDIENESEALI